MKYLLSLFFCLTFELFASDRPQVTIENLPNGEVAIAVIKSANGQVTYESHRFNEAPFRKAILEDDVPHLVDLLDTFILEPHHFDRIVDHARMNDAKKILGVLDFMGYIPHCEDVSCCVPNLFEMSQRDDGKMLYTLTFKSNEKIISYSCLLSEALVLNYLIRDDAEGALCIDPVEKFGPGRIRAITIAVQGSRQNCVKALLARGDGDKILNVLLKRAQKINCTEKTKQLIRERIETISQ